MNTLKKWWPSILPGLVALWTVYGSQVQHFVSAHPEMSTIFGGLYAVVAHLMPSPAAE